MIFGNFDDLGLPDVLRMVEQIGLTGRVTIQRGPLTGHIAMAKGRIVAVELDALPGGGKDEMIDAAVRLLDATGGEFSVSTDPGIEVARLSVDELLANAAKRRARWAEIAAQLGRFDAPIMLTPRRGKGGEVTLTPQQWGVVSCIDGRRSVTEIAHEAGLSAFRAANVLVELLRDGLITVAGDPAADEPEAVTPVEDADVAQATRATAPARPNAMKVGVLRSRRHVRTARADVEELARVGVAADHGREWARDPETGVAYPKQPSSN